MDCETASCNQCSASALTQCENSARIGQCSSYFLQSFQCVSLALFGGGSFCNPQSYLGFGGWLQAVGAHYCGP
jgi:hypothetical protein